MLEVYSKQWVGGSLLDTTTLHFPTPFSRFEFVIQGHIFRGDHIAPVVVVGALVLALGAFFKFTDIGIAVRASAENGERASLLGIPVKRVSTIVWMLAATLSAHRRVLHRAAHRAAARRLRRSAPAARSVWPSP